MLSGSRKKPLSSTAPFYVRAAYLHYTENEMTENDLPPPPVARKEHKETPLHGVVLTDDYAWLRDKENPEVTAYLEAENAYAEAAMTPLNGLREELYREMLSHMKQTDVSVPYRDGEWWYLTRTEEGLQYAIHCRKAGTAAGPDADAPEEVILDGNQLAGEHSTGLIAMNAVASLAATNPRAKQFVEALWAAEVPSGQYRYYDGLLYLMGLLHCSGEFRIWTPPPPSPPGNPTPSKLL